MSDILDSEQVASLLCCEPATVEDKARRGELPGVKFGRSWVFPREALLESLNALARRNLTQPSADPAPAKACQPSSRRGNSRIAPTFPKWAPSP